MKKVLFATTALIATAGFASADVTLTGNGYMGILDTEDNGTQLVQNVDIYVRMSGATDNGLTFSAGVDLENNETYGTNGKGTADTAGGDITGTTTGKNFFASTGSWVSVSGGFGTLTLGNTDGAIDKRTTEVHRIWGFDLEQWLGYVDNADANNILRYDYTFGDIGFSASYADTDDAFGVGFSWSGDLGSVMASFGLGYETSDINGNILAVSAGIDFDGFGLRTAYWVGSDGDTREQLDYSAQYSANGLTVGANFRDNLNSSTDTWMIFVTYDLGGGASLFAHTGEANPILAGNNTNTGGIQTVSAAGIALKF